MRRTPQMQCLWGCYASDFDCPKSKLRMKGMGAIVGGTYGKGRVFTIACHPESYPAAKALLERLGYDLKDLKRGGIAGSAGCERLER